MSMPHAPLIELSEVRSHEQRQALRKISRINPRGSKFSRPLGMRLVDVSHLEIQNQISGFFTDDNNTPTFAVCDGDVVGASVAPTLDGGCLGFVPPELRLFPKLRELSVEQSDLDWIAPWIAKMPNLEELRFQYNEIAEIPPYVCKMNKLRDRKSVV